MDAYQKGPIIGEGTYGSVICATHKASGRRVAIKKVRMASNREGVNMSVLRELKALQALQGPHVVELLDVFTTKSSLVLVFEYMDCSLDDVIRDKATPLSPADVKAYMQMLLQGLAHVHDAGVVHRDIKPDNMLIGGDSTLKLADFGLARSVEAPCSSSDEAAKLTPQVFGRWYRPPELLMGCCHYGCPVDMWAAGCVLAELLLRRPWFPGVCDMDQLDRIFKVLGVPTVQSWPGMADLPHRIDFKPADGQPLQQLFPQASPECLDLLQQLMQFDPRHRISAVAALQHPYFSSSPAPTQVAQLPRPTSGRGRRDLTVPAIMQDLLMRPAAVMRQQDAPAGFCGGGGSSSSRQLFAFSGQHSSFSGRIMSGQGLQQGWPSAAGAAQGAEGMLSSGSRLRLWCRAAALRQQELMLRKVARVMPMQTMLTWLAL
ncbi:hypothetical protein OEZ85_005381 [Tetradesmus obliquus]|uniref:[RNA-polymerase]-subunit kinase n=1 Tax=Tetradesmus obliquus TaxID=3088 RepID=A0ABY8UI59_TETOB|nr:hypothetical protein OEZ85_005381 [Tetradesmus obliquus]